MNSHPTELFSIWSKWFLDHLGKEIIAAELIFFTDSQVFSTICKNGGI